MPSLMMTSMKKETTTTYIIVECTCRRENNDNAKVDSFAINIDYSIV